VILVGVLETANIDSVIKGGEGFISVTIVQNRITPGSQQKKPAAEEGADRR
jgi:hypothetical protein